jgi:hypothetical protein
MTFLIALQWVLMASGVTIYLLVLHEMLKGVYRQMPMLLAYFCATLLGAVVQCAAIFDTGAWTKSTAHLYWFSDMTCRACLLLALIQFLRKSLDDSPASRPIRHLLPIVFVLFTAASFYFHTSPHLTRYMTAVTRDLEFASIVLNMILWSHLLRSRSTLLLSICASLGVQMAGAAIGHSLRMMAVANHSIPLVTAGNYIMVLSHLGCCFLLWRALHRAKQGASIWQPRMTGLSHTPATHGAH